MNLKGIISISGRPGIFKVITQGKNNVIIESINDKKRLSVQSKEKISTLEEITIFTTEDDVKLTEVFSTMLKKYAEKEAPNHKSDEAILVKEMSLLLPKYDKDRVYTSDLRKIFQWYNLLLKADLLKSEEEVAESKEPVVKTKIKKEVSSKKIINTGAPVKSIKTANIKKSAPVKTGSSRGK